MLAGEVCLEASSTLAVFLRMDSFQLKNVWPVLFKNISMIISSAWDVYFPCQDLMSLGPSTDQWRQYEKKLAVEIKSRSGKTTCCQPEEQLNEQRCSRNNLPSRHASLAAPLCYKPWLPSGTSLLQPVISHVSVRPGVEKLNKFDLKLFFSSKITLLSYKWKKKKS